MNSTALRVTALSGQYSVRRCLRQSALRPYQRAAREDTLPVPVTRTRFETQ